MTQTPPIAPRPKKEASPQTEQQAAKKLKEFQKEQQKQKIKHYVLYPVFGIGSLLFCYLLFFGYLDRPLLKMGISPFWHRERGVYADCSDSRNRDNRFCSDDGYSTVGGSGNGGSGSSKGGMGKSSEGGFQLYDK